MSPEVRSRQSRASAGDRLRLYGGDGNKGKGGIFVRKRRCFFIQLFIGEAPSLFIQFLPPRTSVCLLPPLCKGRGTACGGRVVRASSNFSSAQPFRHFLAKMPPSLTQGRLPPEHPSAVCRDRRPRRSKTHPLFPRTPVFPS